MKPYLVLLVIALISNNVFSKPPKTYVVQGETTGDSAKIWLMTERKLAEEGTLHSVNYFQNEEKVKLFPIDIQWKYYKNMAYGQFKIPVYSNIKQIELAYHFKKEISKSFYNVQILNRKNEDTLKILTGSCALMGIGWTRMIQPGTHFPIYKQMQQQNADAMVWTGDNIYYILHWKSSKREIKANVKSRKIKDLANFLASIPNYAMWDDHDFGHNNADGTFKGKYYSRENFLNFWPNPIPADTSSGIYYSFSYPEVEFFMTDNRFSSIKGESYLGKKQMKWLKEQLKKSTSKFKIITTGVQAGNKVSPHETLFKTGEYQEIVDYIRTEKIEGVIFLNGDRHHTAFFKHTEDKCYPLYEFTSSPLSSIPVIPKEGSAEDLNPEKIFKIIKAHQFGMLTFYENEEHILVCEINSIDENGQLRLNYTIKLPELQFKP